MQTARVARDSKRGLEPAPEGRPRARPSRRPRVCERLRNRQKIRSAMGYRLRTSDYRKSPQRALPEARSPKPEARSLTEASPVKIDGLLDRRRFLIRVS